MTGWTLAAAELRIPRRTSFAAHRMLVIAAPSGQAVRQINGLASWLDRRSGAWRHKPIGYLTTDRLRGYDTRAHPRTFLPMNGVARGDRMIGPALASGAARILATAPTEAAMDGLLAPALAGLRRINALSAGPEGGAGLPYPFLGFGLNSNSFFSTMLRVLAFDEPVFARPAGLAPGAGRLLLSEDEIAALRQGATQAEPAVSVT